MKCEGGGTKMLIIYKKIFFYLVVFISFLPFHINYGSEVYCQ